MVKASTDGLTLQLTMDNGQTITSMVMELTSGLMEDNTQEPGKKINCMVRGDILGKMEGATKGNMLMTRRKGLAFMCGPMVESTKVGGEMENSMEKEGSLTLKAKARKESGKRERELGGSKEAKKIEILLAKLLKQLRISQHPLIFLPSSETYPFLKQKLTY